MTAMTSKWNGLFNVGDDFDDEDLLETDWVIPPVAGPANVPTTAPTCVLRASNAAPEFQKNLHRPSAEGTLGHIALQNGSGSQNTTQNRVGQTTASGLRLLSTSTSLRSSPAPPLHPPVLSRGQCTAPGLSSAAVQENHSNTGGQQDAPLPQDDFDDWDIDLADLDETEGTGAQVLETVPASAPAPAPAPAMPSDDPVSPAKRLRHSAYGGTQTVTSVGLRDFRSSNPTSCLSGSNFPPRGTSTVPIPSPGPACSAYLPAPPQSPVFHNLTMASPMSSPFPRHVTPRPVRGPSQLQRQWASPLPQGHGLFDPISPAASVRSGWPMSSPSLTPRSFHTPILTSHLVQLVSDSNKTPQRSRSDHTRPKTRRFPGPAGLLPTQVPGQSMDDIVVAIPQTPAHGAIARLPSQVPSSQNEEEEFSGGPWATMKAEMGLDERNPSCFLHSYSVVMVLRKAALKQLLKNKVPNMAVILKSILYTHADATAVFRDPTGEMQGTVHRRLLEDRLGELKIGALLLLKQVGVFSPSHRNHYLNVTPNNLLKIYPVDGVTLSSTQLSPISLEPFLSSPGQSSSIPGAPVSHMEVLYDDDDDEVCREEDRAPQLPVDSGAGPSQALQMPAGTDQTWDTDDLDELLGELPVESLSF